MYTELNISTFLQKRGSTSILDVRTPDEFNKGHIPGSVNLPLFSNEERKLIGTTYKKSGREQAVRQGIDLVHSKLPNFINSGYELAENKNLLLYCWRGGFRSSSLAWLFDMAGFIVYTLKGGYKTYRNHVLEIFSKPLKMIVIGGMTGSGKTEILNRLAQAGEQVIHLEQLAHHKGSAFGSIGQEKQLSNEQFENILADIIMKLDPGKPVWIEDESRQIGNNQVPDGLYQQIRNSNVICITTDRDIRIKRLIEDYAHFSTDELKQSIHRISKRLGGLSTSRAIDSLMAGRYQETVDIVLHYYDKTYEYSLRQRDPGKIILYLSDHNITEKSIMEIRNLATSYKL
jgi:tRNA 2-selenouridine synthase